MLPVIGLVAAEAWLFVNLVDPGACRCAPGGVMLFKADSYSQRYALQDY